MIRYSLIISTLFFVSQSTIAQNLSGLEDLCLNECQYYKIENGLGGPYLWSIVGGSLDDNQGDSIQICWDKLGVYEIICFDLSAPSTNNKYELEVSVSPEVKAELLFPLNAECGVKDSISGGQGEFPPIECKSACESSLVKYYLNQQTNLLHHVSVLGGVAVDLNTDYVEIAWGQVALDRLNCFFQYWSI